MGVRVRFMYSWVRGYVFALFDYLIEFQEKV